MLLLLLLLILVRRRRRIGPVGRSTGGREEQGIEIFRTGRQALRRRPCFRSLGEALGVELPQDLLGADTTALAGRCQDVAHFLLDKGGGSDVGGRRVCSFHRLVFASEEWVTPQALLFSLFLSYFARIAHWQSRFTEKNEQRMISHSKDQTISHPEVTHSNSEPRSPTRLASDRPRYHIQPGVIRSWETGSPTGQAYGALPPHPPVLPTFWSCSPGLPYQ